MRARLERMEALQKGTAPPSESSAINQADPPGYRELVDDALREYDAANYEEARSLFARAHAVFPNARTHRGIGKADFELRNYAESIAQLEQALASNVRPLDEKLRVDTEELLSRARAFVGWLVVQTKPAATEVRIDGVPVDVTQPPIDGHADTILLGSFGVAKGLPIDSSSWSKATSRPT